MTPEDYAVFCRFLENSCGIVLGDKKDYLVASRLSPLMLTHGIDSLQELVELAAGRDGSGLRECIVDAMTTNETFWFRDGYPFEVLKQRILPELTQSGVRQIRIWSAGCSSGEEPYSISMAIQEYLLSDPSQAARDTQIIATDISSSMLKQSMLGLYDSKFLSRGLSPERRQRFFIPSGDKWEVKEEVRKRVRFQELNLMENFLSLGRHDVIFCRNVLIYFSTELRRDILRRMAQILNPGGRLLVGASESVANYSDAFEMVRHQAGVIYRLKAVGDP